MKIKYRYRVETSDKKVWIGWMTEGDPQTVAKALWKKWDNAVVIYVEEESIEEDDEAIGEGE